MTSGWYAIPIWAAVLTAAGALGYSLWRIERRDLHRFDEQERMRRHLARRYPDGGGK